MSETNGSLTNREPNQKASSSQENPVEEIERALGIQDPEPQITLEETVEFKDTQECEEEIQKDIFWGY